MKPIVAQTLRSRWFAVCVHTGLWLLLYLVLAGLHGRTPEFGESRTARAAAGGFVPLSALGRVRAGAPARLALETNALSPFFTRHFIPAATPAPPPPTTRKVELTYLGFYQTDAGPITTLVKLGDSFLVTPVGSRLTANQFAANATLQTLLLTNAAAQTNLLELNVKKELEVPIQ